MKNGFLTYLVAKNRSRNLKWRVPSAMVAAIAFLFAFQGFSRADDDHNSRADDDHEATAITTCEDISQPGRYYLEIDLKQCNGFSITASDVELDLRGHTIQGLGPSTPSALITANGGTTGLYHIKIEGPGTLTGGLVGVLFLNVHHSQVDELVVAGNTFGIWVAGNMVVPVTNLGTVVKPADLRSVQTIPGTAPTDNEFRDNVVAGQTADGFTVIDSDQNLFIHNNLSGNGGVGLDLLSGNYNMVRHNTVDSNVGVGIFASGSGNRIDHNTALGNLGNTLDLEDETAGCTNTWTDNSFNFSFSAFPSCIR
jgi:parallel beta-helix repeat protein